MPSLTKSSVELEDYDIMEQIGSGKLSWVYLVNCKRGRLRNRQLALRKLLTDNQSEPSEPEASGSSSIHLSLSHPSITSLFSCFSTPLAHFQLLELCSGGSLSDHLAGKSLSEDRLRGVMKSLLEALVYLKKQGVIHRNIKPSNVLLTSDGRVKLGDFKLATYMPPSDLPDDCFEGGLHFVAPEILRNASYTCDADLWSVGCIASTCLSGRLPFEADTNSKIENNILNARYILPANLSVEAQDLVTRLLEIDSTRRVAAHSALSHSFFSSAFPVNLLDFGLPNVSNSILSKHALFESSMGHAKAKTSSFGFSRRKPPRRSYPEQKPSSSHEQSAARRVVSDPLPQATRFTSRVTASILLPSQNTNLQPQAESSSSSSRSQDRNVIHFATTSTGLTDTVPSPSTIPVGTTRPLPITTSLLSPEVHKTVNGQITILQSHSLLVDFREGERRRGRQGTEVFVVNPQGTEIEVYDAPHLSLPCCLAEPNRKYTIENLPSTYWKQYNDASILVERIKQRTPKLILLTPTAKCLLMANTLPGDIELLFGSPLPHDRKSGTVLPTDATRMRIRLSRQTRTLEMAKHLSGARGEEWTKKVLTTTNEFPHVSSLDWDNMEADEREGIKDLTCFWRTCEAVEQSECASYSASHSCKSPASHSTNSRTSSTVPQINFLPNGPTWNLPASFSSTQTLPWMTVPLAPRPSKLPLIPANTCRKAAQQPPPSPSVLDIPSMEAQYPSVTGKTGILPTWCREDNNELTPAQHHFVSSQTKFIPTVGWCIRQSSRVSQGGRYKIMFFDGATLEIDVDEDWAELTGPNGGTTRHNIGDCNMKRHVAERMKVFGEFVSMFDETEEG